MGHTGKDWKRRVDDRRHVDGSALISQRGDSLGRYALESLSARGARIQASSGLRPGHLVHLLVELQNGEPPLSLTGSLQQVRGDDGENSVVVQFRVLSADQEDAIQDALLRALLRRGAPGARLPFLVFEPRHRVRDEIESELRSFSMAVRSVETVEELVRELETDDTQYAGLIVHSATHDRAAMEVIEFFARTERLKTILLPEPDGTVSPLAARLPHARIPTRWSRSELRAAVRSVLSN